MALKAILTLSSGIELLNGYAIITNCEFNFINPISAIISVNIYKDLDAYNAGRVEVIQMKYPCVMEKFQLYFSEDVLSQASNTILSQAYLFLKTFDQFTDF